MKPTIHPMSVRDASTSYQSTSLLLTVRTKDAISAGDTASTNTLLSLGHIAL
ncbi:hypothetical protein FOQG_16693 [Fusarium oxysporum f. sp. raphani 54005]|uniref:Uncharacterized protein n=2 Tax=Fusarium oxysporum TaxID=5507 RepID=X0B901_FUSOX|nr:hypothetical protein FOMG_17349 [Fusarium oxysporum f. sp. melonis 26406]EXK78630.1 hypothetical protein FOQG_16693 [Fusarium oxysporum f. sp. raphani 54005]